MRRAPAPSCSLAVGLVSVRAQSSRQGWRLLLRNVWLLTSRPMPTSMRFSVSAYVALCVFCRRRVNTEHLSPVENCAVG